MKETLEYLVGQLVDHPDAVVISEESGPEGKMTLIIHVHEEDMGRIIGKQGRIIRAIRDLIKLIATKRNVYIDVTLSEVT